MSFRKKRTAFALTLALATGMPTISGCSNEIPNENYIDVDKTTYDQLKENGYIVRGDKRLDPDILQVLEDKNRNRKYLTREEYVKKYSKKPNATPDDCRRALAKNKKIPEKYKKIFEKAINMFEEQCPNLDNALAYDFYKDGSIQEGGLSAEKTIAEYHEATKSIHVDDSEINPDKTQDILIIWHELAHAYANAAKDNGNWEDISSTNIEIMQESMFDNYGILYTMKLGEAVHEIFVDLFLNNVTKEYGYPEIETDYKKMEEAIKVIFRLYGIELNTENLSNLVESNVLDTIEFIAQQGKVPEEEVFSMINTLDEALFCLQSGMYEGYSDEIKKSVRSALESIAKKLILEGKEDEEIINYLGNVENVGDYYTEKGLKRIVDDARFNVENHIAYLGETKDGRGVWTVVKKDTAKTTEDEVEL